MMHGDRPWCAAGVPALAGRHSRSRTRWNETTTKQQKKEGKKKPERREIADRATAAAAGAPSDITNKCVVRPSF